MKGLGVLAGVQEIGVNSLCLGSGDLLALGYTYGQPMGFVGLDLELGRWQYQEASMGLESVGAVALSIVGGQGYGEGALMVLSQAFH